VRTRVGIDADLLPPLAHAVRQHSRHAAQQRHFLHNQFIGPLPDAHQQHPARSRMHASSKKQT
jgi:hypothetical protein